MMKVATFLFAIVAFVQCGIYDRQYAEDGLFEDYDYNINDPAAEDYNINDPVADDYNIKESLMTSKGNNCILKQGMPRITKKPVFAGPRKLYLNGGRDEALQSCMKSCKEMKAVGMTVSSPNKKNYMRCMCHVGLYKTGSENGKANFDSCKFT